MPQTTRQPTLWSRARFWTIFILAFSVFYRVYVHNVLVVVFGLGRHIQRIEEFPWDCTRLSHPLLEACEDMWLDHHDRKLYAACSTTESRQGWAPGGNLYNASARSLTDHIAILDIDHLDLQPRLPVPRQLKVDGYDGALDLHGFDVRHIGDKVRFWLINHKPFVNSTTGEILDPSTLGANSTIEIFDLNKEKETLEHVKTLSSDAIISPNNLAVEADGIGMIISNDHKGKTGTFRDLENLRGTGSLAYCRSDTGSCHIAARSGFQLPNGVAKGRDGLFYVAHSVTGIVSVHELKNGHVEQVGSIPTGYPVDNLSFDENGVLIAAAIPDGTAFWKASLRPRELVAPATVLGIPPIENNKNREVLKIIEDALGEKLPSSTVALHDAAQERLFLAGIFSPFITICAKQK